MAGNRVEVRIRGVWGDIASEHAFGSDFDHADDGGYAVGRCVDAVFPRPLAVLAGAVLWLAESRTSGLDEEEGRLAQALTDAATAYADFWRRHDEALGIGTGAED